MGRKGDQSFDGTTNRAADRTAASATLLPPQDNNRLSPVLPPTYVQSQVYTSRPLSGSWAEQDPRHASTDSLVPSGASDGRRTLLAIYIHGYMGNETSFQSFPAHIHNLLTYRLKESHVVHTKMYPKYKSRRAFEFARDDFSRWYFQVDLLLRVP
jgi:hypothetical protein